MAEAGVVLRAVGVEDPQRRPTPWWAGAIARDDHLRSLADDVSAEPDPRSTAELQSNARRLADGGCHVVRKPCRLEHEQGDAGSTGERRQPAEPVGELGWPAGSGVLAASSGCAGSRFRAGSHFRGGTSLRLPQPVRQVDHEQVHRPPGQQRTGDRQALIRVRGRHHDEPRRIDAARDRFDRIERRREVQPRDDSAGRLRLCRQPERERGPTARGIAAHRHAHPPRHAAGTEDGIELREASREDPGRVDGRRYRCR